MPLSKIGGIFLTGVITVMKRLEVNGFKVRLTKYKLMILDDEGKLRSEEAYGIAQYLYDEGFIKKDNFPVEIIGSDE